ncbi:MAG: type I methionyl aminopeptidase [Gemmatimonadales bacterium]|nr:type I methionyl aminopeptidase [Gemmatimonadales bacterium]
MSWSKQQIKLKSTEQVDKMQASAEILASVFLEVRNLVRPGVTTKALDESIEAMIRDANCIPSFKGYHGFPAAACISIDEEVVHGIPGDRVLVEGSIVGIDIGLIKDNWHADSAETLPVGEIGPAAAKLLTVTEECLQRAIASIEVGRRLSVIGIAVEDHARANGYSVVETLVGHGIGLNLHEDPQVPNFRCFTMPDPVMEEGLVIAIEPMINEGTKRVVTARDQWTVITADKGLSAHFEHTVAVTSAGPRVLTRRESGIAALPETRQPAD